MIIVTLRNKGRFTGTGYVHEYLLANAGWNEAPAYKKYGYLTAPHGHLSYAVEFPHFDVRYVLFADEIFYEGVI